MANIERIVVMGAGPGGIAAAAGLARGGLHVALYNRSPGRIAALVERGGVEIEGSLGEDFVKLPVITTDAAEAMRDAQLILTAVPANGQQAMIEACLPYLQPGQLVVLMTGSAGSLEVVPLLKEAGHDLDQLILGEFVVVPYSARMTGDARVRIKLSSNKKPKRMRAATFPGRNVDRLMDAVGDLFSLLPKSNVLDPAINNPNFMIHPAPMVTNYAAVERAEKKFSIMNAGMTPGTLRLLDAVDAEKMALQKALGFEVVSIDDFYRETGVGPQTYRESGEPFGLHDWTWDRYVTEDVPYGTVMYASLGRLLSVPTPVNDSIITIHSVLAETDFWTQGRTVERLGLAGLTRSELLHYLETGEKPV